MHLSYILNDPSVIGDKHYEMAEAVRCIIEPNRELREIIAFLGN